MTRSSQERTVPRRGAARWTAFLVCKPVLLMVRRLKRPVVTIDVGQRLGLDDLRERGSGPEVVHVGARRLANILTTMIENLRGDRSMV